jgi:hypothetical protein
VENLLWCVAEKVEEEAVSVEADKDEVLLGESEDAREWDKRGEETATWAFLFLSL